MEEWVNNLDPYDGRYGKNHNSMYYDANTILNAAEAIKFFSLWYEQGNFYNYENEIENEDEGNVVVQHVI